MVCILIRHNSDSAWALPTGLLHGSWQATHFFNFFGFIYNRDIFWEREKMVFLYIINSFRIPPKFPPVLWNVREATMNGDPRTNNICESWNHRFASLVGHHHPRIWKSLKFIKREEAVASTKIQQYLVGVMPTKQTKQKYLQQQQRLRNLCVEHDAGRLNMAQFLRGIGHNIHLGDD